MAMTGLYEPRGKMIDLMAAIRSEPARLFRIAEVASILHCKAFPSTIDQYLYAAVAAGLVFRINLRGEWLYAGREINDELLVASGRAPRDNTGLRTIASPFTDEDRKRANADHRAPGPTGFIPKGMSAPRPGSEEPRTAPESKSELKSAKIQAAIQADMEPRTDRGNRVLVGKLRAALPHWEEVAPSGEILIPKFGEAPASDFGKRTTSAATASGHEIPDLASTPEKVEAAGPGQERHQAQDQHSAGAQERCGEVANEGEAREASGAFTEVEEEEEAVEFNAAVWLDGDVVVYGAQANDDGSFTLSPDQVGKLASLFEASKIAMLFAGAIAGKAVAA